MHSILTYQMENTCKGCINRDNNAVKNFIKLTNYYLEHKKRPEKYKRPKPIKIKYHNPGAIIDNFSCIWNVGKSEPR